MAPMTTLEAALENQKPRLFDMFALGPFMLWYALKSGKRTMGPWSRRALFVSGAMTIVYNWKNYQNIQAILTDKVNQVQQVSNDLSTQISGGNFLRTK